MIKLDSQNYQRKAWKNGGGESRQVLIYPPNSDLDNFGYRITIANVASDGPFSRFEGVDRSLLLLFGDGISMHFKDNLTPIFLNPASKLLQIAGEDEIDCRLIGSKVIDFNVMTRRNFYHHLVTDLIVTDTHDFICTATIAVILLATDTNLQVINSNHQYQLRMFDAVLLQFGDKIALKTGNYPTRVLISQITNNQP
jgi:environmental stress-induced protein Ves